MSEPYILLRAALGLFKKSPTELGDTELQQVQRQARNGLAIANPTKPAYSVLRWVAKKRQPNLHGLNDALRFLSCYSIKLI
ncbi:MAG: hypothetical protein WCK96_13025 [Methylococcales bacterium]